MPTTPTSVWFDDHMAMRSISLTQRKQQRVILSDLVNIYIYIITIHGFLQTTRSSSKTSSISTAPPPTYCLFRSTAMINPKRLIAMAKKWQRIAANKRKRISYPKAESSVANKGHFVVYTTDNKRFVVPLEYLSQNVFRELLRMSEEEFGLPSNGPITLPCDGVFMDYIISLVQWRMPVDLEKALLTSMATCHSSTSYSLALGQFCQQQTLIYGF
jgi:hypothetical protein